MLTTIMLLSYATGIHIGREVHLPRVPYKSWYCTSSNHFLYRYIQRQLLLQARIHFVE